MEKTLQMPKPKSETKVFLGLSGGVDSAVAAYLLKKEGYQVTCGFMRNWDSFTNGDIEGNPTIKEETCTQEKDYQDAQAVAEALGLPLVRIDFIKNYWEDVFSDFIRQYELGNTPNPDILCNKHIKFSAFYDYAKKEGFDYLATGHYARVKHEAQGSQLLKGVDENKDQSYFLAEISSEALAHTLFPLGEIDKQEVRRLALELQLPVAKKKDSTGICFIGEREFRAFLSNYIPKTLGEIRNIDTFEPLGQHSGVMFYTYGQRKGLDISHHAGPWFVAGKDRAKNRLFVAKGEQHPWLYSDACITEKNNLFLSLEEAVQLVKEKSLDCHVKLRYRQKDIPARLSLRQEYFSALNASSEDYEKALEAWEQEILRLSEAGAEGRVILPVLPYLHIELKEKCIGVSPGQEAVFYLDDRCIGGGRMIVALKEKQSLQQRLEAHLPLIEESFVKAEEEKALKEKQKLEKQRYFANQARKKKAKK